ncbi:unnamed protein product [Meganyctiphanes norvegica]|uniref:Uncharacterized protein n=1 Tax=Meganyctiphanes norvegica TaxID=48144 RepID=A0AAV2PMJ7_MEGNR
MIFQFLDSIYFMEDSSNCLLGGPEHCRLKAHILFVKVLIMLNPLLEFTILIYRSVGCRWYVIMIYLCHLFGFHLKMLYLSRLQMVLDLHEITFEASCTFNPQVIFNCGYHHCFVGL